VALGSPVDETVLAEDLGPTMAAGRILESGLALEDGSGGSALACCRR
jgi:hypothetical protein